MPTAERTSGTGIRLADLRPSGPVTDSAASSVLAAGGSAELLGPPLTAETRWDAAPSNRPLPEFSLNRSGENDGLVRTPRLRHGGVSPHGRQLQSPEDYRRLADDPQRPGPTTIVTLGVNSDEGDLDEAMARLAEQGQVGPVLGLHSGTRSHEDPLYDSLETIEHLVGLREIPTVRSAVGILEDHLNAEPPAPLHVIAHSQGTAVWATAVERYTEREVERRLADRPSASEADLRQEVEAELSQHLTIEALAPVADFPPGPQLIRYENEGDAILDLVDPLVPDDEDGITVTPDGLRELDPNAELSSGHSLGHYLRMREAAQHDPRVQEIFRRR